MKNGQSYNRFPVVITRMLGFFLVLGLISIATGLLYLVRGELNTSTVALLYLILVSLSTARWGLWPGLLSAFAAFLAYNYFFLQPYYTFIVHESQDIVTLLIFLVIAVFINQLVGRARSGMAASVARERETTRLYELSLELAGAGSLEEIAAVVARKIAETLKVKQVEISLSPLDGETAYSLSIPEPPLASSTPSVSLPLETAREVLGELRVWLENGNLSPAEGRLLRAFTAQAALALERTALAHAKSHALVLEESDRLKSALLSSVSHEFRTPLATIKAATTSLLDQEVPWEAPARDELLAVVDEEADYLNHLVGNLLDMSRIEAGALKPNRQWNILAEIVDGVLARLSQQLSPFHLAVHIPEDLPLVPVDYYEMEQVFINLLTNSAKYAPEESTIKLSVSLQEENVLLVCVSNEGPQVAAEHLDRIFDKFYRVTEPERVSGTGLGLSICKGMVEAHGGRIWAENVSGGLAFFFTLPLTLDGNPPPRIEAENL